MATQAIQVANTKQERAQQPRIKVEGKLAILSGFNGHAPVHVIKEGEDIYVIAVPRDESSEPKVVYRAAQLYHAQLRGDGREAELEMKNATYSPLLVAGFNNINFDRRLINWSYIDKHPRIYPPQGEIEKLDFREAQLSTN
jgi:hypothetical protein